MAGFVRADGVDIDDDADRLDLVEIHRFLSGESYWARDRDRATTTRLVRGATRVVGAYHAGDMIGFARCLSDEVTVAWIGDVFVAAAFRGRGIGHDVVAHLIEGSTFSHVRWLLGTADAHSFYAKLGFGPPSPRIIERPRRHGDPPGPGGDGPG